MNQLTLFALAPIYEVCTCGAIIESGRLCENCRIEHRRESKRKYANVLYEDNDYEIPYNAINERWTNAEYEMIETIGEYRKGSHWTTEDMIVARDEGDLPGDLWLLHRQSKNYIQLMMV